MQKLAILGSTGSVGKSTLDVVMQNQQHYSVVALSGASNVEQMLQQCKTFSPKRVVMTEVEAAEKLDYLLIEQGFRHIDVQSGQAALQQFANYDDIDIVMSAIVGAAGLMPTLVAVQSGKRVLIANKEPLVMTGDLLMQEASVSGASILPIDSEHNAVFQCLPDDGSQQGVYKVHLTASGGPFRGQSWESLSQTTPAEACAHPIWSMGRKISVDSATMMNKGLELIEASALFGLPASDVEIIIHPQSIVHSLVEYIDGSFLAQMGAPDMCIPIAHALGWPQRINSGARRLNLADIARLDFQQPDMKNLPCLVLARQAAEAGGALPAVLNAANEVAVAAFLAGKLPFTSIPIIIDSVMNAVPTSELSDINDVLQIDNEARQLATAALNSLAI